jgi:uncharacterized protein with HEPN domain
MSDREWKLFLKDIEKSINKILNYTKGLNRQEFFGDDKTFDAVMRNLEIIGEAVKHFPDEIREQYKKIAWKKIAGLRDIVIHEYFGIDEDIIWDVVHNKIPELKPEIKTIIEDIFDHANSLKENGIHTE